MARYDVFLASSLADSPKAELIVRRLRALKFKVRHDKKRTHTTPTPRDFRDADKSRSVLVLWSKAACDPESADKEWVDAMARHARSTPDRLLQATLDATVPDAPFDQDDRFALSGMGPRKLVEGYFQLIETLGERNGRTHLREWSQLKASDKSGKDKWKQAHPSDPLAQTGKAPVPVAEPPRRSPAIVEPPVIPPISVQTLNPPKAPTHTDDAMGNIMLLAVSLVLSIMILMSALMSSGQVATLVPGTPAGGATLVAQCPPGQLPAYLLDLGDQPLQPGGVIDDTDDPDENEDPDDDEVLQFDLN